MKKHIYIHQIEFKIKHDSHPNDMMESKHQDSLKQITQVYEKRSELIINARIR